MQPFKEMAYRLVLHMLFLLYADYVFGDLTFPEACSELSQAGTGIGKYADIVSRQSNVDCNKSSPGFTIWSRWISKRNAVLRVVFHRCQKTGRVWIMAKGEAHFLPTSPNLRITSCHHTNDTVIVPDDGHYKEKMDIHTLSEKGANLIVLAEEKDGDSVFYTTHKYHLAPATKHRHHRERREAAPAPAPSTDDASPSSFNLKECGKNRTCVRFGSSGCHHMSCDYFLSYRVFNTETVEIELSGKTNGWVAVGFSSDEKMGGGDDVIACKRKDESTDKIETLSLLNQVAHTSPQVKPSALTLHAWTFKNEHIYCKVSRKLKVDLDNNLDLSNDWFQLYARGPVGSSGVMLQHDKVPKASDEKITMLINKDIAPSSAPRLWQFTSSTILGLVVYRLSTS